MLMANSFDRFKTIYNHAFGFHLNLQTVSAMFAYLLSQYILQKSVTVYSKRLYT